MNEPDRTQWEIRCAFNGFCKRTLRNASMAYDRNRERRVLHEISFSSLSPQEEGQLYSKDEYFADEESEKSFCVAGREITAKQLADALRRLPEEKRESVLMYYFDGLTDAEIAKLLHSSRSTIQYRRTSSFELLKRYLEEHTDGKW